MSEIKFFPEQSTMRSTLLEIGAGFALDKPTLDSRLSQSLGSNLGARLEQLETKLTDPDTGFIKQDFLDILVDFRLVTDKVDANFLLPEGFALYRSGALSGEVGNDFTNLRIALTDKIYPVLGSLYTPGQAPPANAEELSDELKAYADFFSHYFSCLFFLIDFQVSEPDFSTAPWLDFFEDWPQMFAEGGMIKEFRNFYALQSLRGVSVNGPKPQWEPLFEYIFLNSAFEIFPPKNVASYELDDVILEMVGFAAGIKEVRVSKGCLPKGVKLDSATGTISIIDDTVLSSGVFQGIQLEVIDNLDTSNFHTIDLQFLEDFEAEYTLNTAKPSDEYVLNDLIASVMDPDAEIVQACIAEGKLPKGMSFNTQNGQIMVYDSNKLKPGTTSLTIMTTDLLGGESKNIISIEILDPSGQGASNPSTYRYVEVMPKIYTEYLPGELLASLPLPLEGLITNVVIVNTSLPAGFSLDGTNGNILVADPAVLAKGMHFLQVQVTFDTVGSQVYDAYVGMYSSAAFDYTISSPKTILNYAAGDVLATPPSNASGITQASESFSHPIPQGTELDFLSGVLSVLDPINLILGPQFMNVNLLFGDATTQDYVIEHMVWPDINIKYILNPSQVAPTLINGDVIAYVTVSYASLSSALLTAGTLPAGMSLDASTGMISVSDSTLLVSGTDNITVQTVDDWGFTENHVIDIVVD